MARRWRQRLPGRQDVAQILVYAQIKFHVETSGVDCGGLCDLCVHARVCLCVCVCACVRVCVCVCV